MGTLDGKVAVITGGSRGIGRITADLFAHEGARIAICGRTEETLRAAANELTAAHGVKVIWQRADILDTASVERFIAHVDKELGRIDILVNNAGESSQREVNGLNWPVNAVDAVSRISARCQMIFAPWSAVSSFAAAFKVSSVRPQIAMRAPSRAKRSAAMRPMPRLPPVMTATLP